MELSGVQSVKNEVKEESQDTEFENVGRQFERQHSIPPHILQHLPSRKEGNMQLVQLEDGKFTYIIE